MPRPHHPEVPLIKRGDLRFVQSFDDCQDRGIHKADLGVGVLEYQVAGSCQVIQ